MLSSSFKGSAKEGLGNGLIAVVCRKHLPKVGFHSLDKFERRASSHGSNDGNLFSLVIDPEGRCACTLDLAEEKVSKE